MRKATVAKKGLKLNWLELLERNKIKSLNNEILESNNIPLLNLFTRSNKTSGSTYKYFH